MAASGTESTYRFERLCCLVNNDYIKRMVAELPATSGMTCSKDDLQLINDRPGDS